MIQSSYVLNTDGSLNTTAIYKVSSLQCLHDELPLCVVWEPVISEDVALEERHEAVDVNLSGLKYN